MDEILEEILSNLKENIDFPTVESNLLLLNKETLEKKAQSEYFADKKPVNQLNGVNQFYHLPDAPFCRAKQRQDYEIFSIFPMHNPGRDFTMEKLVRILKSESFLSFGAFRRIMQLPARYEKQQSAPQITCLGLFAYRKDELIAVHGFNYDKQLKKVNSDGWDFRLIIGEEEPINSLFIRAGYKTTSQY
jgi:hypothetical protein